MSPKPAHISVDEARILPRFRLVEQQANVFRTEYAHARAAGVDGKALQRPAPGDAEPGDLRGIPVVGARGVGGVSPGTDPYTATANKLDRERAA